MKYGKAKRTDLDKIVGNHVSEKQMRRFLDTLTEDVYIINSLKRSRLTEKDSNPNLEIYKEEDFNANINKNETGDEDDIQGGNVIFANSLNIDSKEEKINTFISSNARLSCVLLNRSNIWLLFKFNNIDGRCSPLFL